MRNGLFTQAANEAIQMHQTCSNPYSLKKWFWNLIIRNAQDAAEPKENYYLNKSRLAPSKVWIFYLISASKEKMKKGIELCS